MAAIARVEREPIKEIDLHERFYVRFPDNSRVLMRIVSVEPYGRADPVWPERHSYQGVGPPFDVRGEIESVHLLNPEPDPRAEVYVDADGRVIERKELSDGRTEPERD